VTEAYLPKIEEWIEASKGRIRADKAHEKLLALGYTGSERSTRRAIAQVKAAWRLGHTRVHRPWITEPGMWLQYDFGDGPRIGGVKTSLFVAWLAFSLFRIAIPLRDRTAPSMFAALNRCFRILGGAPTYVLTDNEKTVTTAHVAGVPVRNQQTLDFARHYGITVLTCQPGDPATKGGVETSVKLAKADLVPTDTSLRTEYGTFAELEAACAAFMDEVNHREHRMTRRKPAAMLAEEAPRLHRIPDTAHTVAFGLVRTVPENTPMITFENAQYSVPAHLLGARVFVRTHGTGQDEQVIIVHHGTAGPVEVARHGRARPGSPAVNDEHFPATRTKVSGDYEVRAAARTKPRSWPSAKAPEPGCWKPQRPGQQDEREDGRSRHAGQNRRHRPSRPGPGRRSPAWPVRAPGPRLDPERQHQTHHHARRQRSHLADPGNRRLGRDRQHRPEHHSRHHLRGCPMSPVTTINTAAPPLPADLEALMRSLKMPHARALAPGADRDRPRPALGAGRSHQSPLRRRSRRQGPVHARLPPQGRRLPNRENLVVCGPSGTEKTFFLEALGQQAVEAGMRVAWFRLEDLGVLIRAHGTDDSVTRAVSRLSAPSSWSSTT
jgi:hypothetical protein